MRRTERLMMNVAVLGLLVIAIAGSSALAKAEYKIHISNVEREVHKNWIGIPKSVDYKVVWEVYKKDQDKFTRTDYKVFPIYKVYCSGGDSTFENVRPEVVRDKHSLIFTNKDVGVKYYFMVEGVSEDGQVVVQSDTAWVVTGRPDVLTNIEQKKNFLYIINPGRWVLFIFGKEEVYDHATIFGKVAFWLITAFLLLGLYIWFVNCTRFLSFGRIFPFTPQRFLKFTFRSQTYEKRESPKFRFILEAWRSLILDCLRVVESKAPNLEEMSKVCATYWHERGAHVVKALDGLIEYAPGGKDMDAKKKELTEKIEKYLFPKEDAPEAQEEHWQKLRSRYDKIKGDLLWSDIGGNPTVRIIQAGLENHGVNGYKWLEASSEVDRAIENRASAEVEELKRISLVDWLWNLGATAPLVGLFGTVTGISVAFYNLTKMSRATDQLELIRHLAGGINEALWTTILGLIIGILFLLAYYYFKNKMDWVYSKWEEIYVHVSESL